MLIVELLGIFDVVGAEREDPVLIRVDIDCQKGEAWIMRLVFYDKYDVEAGSVTIRDEVTDFQCPLKTYSYRMQLINGGMTHFHFHSVTVQEIESV